MSKYRIIPKNISHGKEASLYIKNKIGLPLGSNRTCFKEFSIEALNDANNNYLYSVTNSKKWNHRFLDKKSIKKELDDISIKPKNFMGLKNKRFYIMGILNITPDSFSETNTQIPSVTDSIDKAIKMYEEGADIIDIGGETSKPGSSSVGECEEQNRIIPVIKELSKMNINISCDTKNSKTMEKAIDAGATIINDISALGDKNAADIISKNKVGVILMHMKGTPLDMQNNPKYHNVSIEITNYLSLKKQYALEKGIKENKILLDPGIGFGKKDSHNIKIFRDLSMLHILKSNIMIGASRKSMIGRLTNSSLDQRLPSSIALAISAIEKGVSFFRVHDVKETFQALTIWNSLNK